MMMVDDGGGRGVKNGQKSDDVINGRPPSYIHYDIKREEAKLHILKLASVFHHLPSVGSKQLCVLAHLGCTCEADTYK